MTIQSVLLPVFGLVFMIFFMLGWTIWARMSSGFAEGLMTGWQGRTKLIGSCLQSQFEMPPLFLVLVILAIMTRKADLTFVVMEWLFVLARLGHAFIFVTTNDHKTRRMAFILSALILFLMWLIFAIRILFSPTFGAV